METRTVRRCFRLAPCDLQLVVEENSVFTEGRMRGVIDICKQTAIQLFSVLGVQPARLRRFHDDRTEQTVYIGTVFVTGGITHIVEDIDSLMFGVPGVGDPVEGGGIFIIAHTRTVRGLNVIRHALYVDRERAV